MEEALGWLELKREQKRNLIAERKLKMKYGALPTLNTSSTSATGSPISSTTRTSNQVRVRGLCSMGLCSSGGASTWRRLAP